MEKSEQIGLLSIGVNAFLVIIKAVLAFLSGSMALVADSIHSLSDVVSAGTVLAGIRISKRKSKTFPYGLYKVENLVSLISSLFIFFAGYEIGKTAFLKQESLNLDRLPVVIFGVVGTIAITFLFSRYELKQGRRIEAPSLIADAEHIKTDMLSSAVILVGLVGSFFRLPLDRVAALIVVFFIGKAGLRIFVDSIRVLLDASLDFETMDLVKRTIEKDPQVDQINGLWGRNSGRFKFIEADISLRVRQLEKAHRVSKRIEESIKGEVAHVDHILIHYEPSKRDTLVCGIPLEKDKNTVSSHFGDAPIFYLATIRVNDRSILEERFLKNPFLDEEKGKGIKVSEWLLREGVDMVLTRKDFGGRGPSYVFSDGGVDVQRTPAANLSEIQRAFRAMGL